MQRRTLLSGAVAAAATALLAFGIPGAVTAAPEVHRVVIDNMKFGPTPADVHVGDVILWINKDMFRHTATARDGSFNIDLAAGRSGKTVVKHSGTMPFYCAFHPGMKGALKVTAK